MLNFTVEGTCLDSSPLVLTVLAWRLIMLILWGMNIEPTPISSYPGNCGNLMFMHSLCYFFETFLKSLWQFISAKSFLFVCCDLFSCFLVLVNRVKFVRAWSLYFYSLGVVLGRKYNNFRTNCPSYIPNSKSNVWFLRTNSIFVKECVKVQSIVLLDAATSSVHIFISTRKTSSMTSLSCNTWFLGDTWQFLLVYSQHQVSRTRSSF